MTRIFAATPRGRPGAVPIELTINGAQHALRFEPYISRLDLLREQLHLTGTNKGCGHAQCGACTVLVNGVPIAALLERY